MFRPIIAAVIGLALVATIAIAQPAPTTNADMQLDSEELQFITLINNYRQQNGRQPLAIDWKIRRRSG